jgi:squalene-hopene/tetraprenyl-beta-curcumene cyclase
MSLELRLHTGHPTYVPSWTAPRVSAPVALARAVQHLLAAREQGWADLTHTMAIAGLRPGGLASGSVFQRALALDTLAALAAEGVDLPQAMLRGELAALMVERDPESGGFKSFPRLLELPPDANDLAQVIQAALAVEPARATRWFAQPLALVERLAAGANGAIPTWLVDPVAADEPSLRYRAAIAAYWGSAPDTEIAANLAYACWRLDSKRHAQLVREAAEFVAARQALDGSWESGRHCGKAYGTWMATRLLAVVEGHEDALVGAADWLESEESGVGPLGQAGAQPLGVALAVLTARELEATGWGGARPLIARGLAFLCDTQEEDGGWPAAPFIRIDARRAARERDPEIAPVWHNYGSRALTTTLCARALGVAAGSAARRAGLA